MGIFATRRQRKDFGLAVLALRDCGIAVSGPYRRPNGVLVFSVEECVVTEDELLRFLRDGSFETNEFQELLSEIKRRPS
jgi:hypothetical protein